MTASVNLPSQKPVTTHWSRLRGWLWVIPIILALIIGSFPILQPIQVLRRMNLAPGYTLTDQNGTPLGSEAMRGKIVVYNFSYTNCSLPCISTMPLMQTVYQQLESLSSSEVPIEMVTISVDPARDTAETLQAYATTLGADTAVWHFATGSPAELKWIVGSGFNLYYQSKPEGTIALDTALIIVDWTGTIRADYRHFIPDASLIMRDLQVLSEEVQNSRGVARYAYEAAHLFGCYPH